MVQPTNPTRRQLERRLDELERLTWSEIGSEKWAAQQRNCAGAPDTAQERAQKNGGSKNILADVVAEMAVQEWDELKGKRAPPNEPQQRALLAAHEMLRADINHRGIVRVPPGSQELPAYGNRGGFYDWQFYLRAPLLRPQNLNYIAVYFWSAFLAKFKQQPFQLCGVEAASVPIITALLLGGKGNGLDVSAFTIRKERKEYGLRNVIEGVPTNQPVMYIDDLTAEGHKTIWYAINVLAQAGLKLYPHAFVVVFKGKSDASRALPSSIGTTLIHSLYTLDDFDMTLAEYVQKKPR